MTPNFRSRRLTGSHLSDWRLSHHGLQFPGTSGRHDPHSLAEGGSDGSQWRAAAGVLSGVPA